MRWISTKGEFAFLSIGAQATGVIAIGAVATGIVAIGAFVSVGAISISMNAVGTVVAAGMNAAAPISFAAINGVGLYTLAGVNAWGGWTSAGVNASGIAGHGGVNTDVSILPAIFVIVALVGGSFLLQGKRRKRADVANDAVRLRDYLRDEKIDSETVHARLIDVRDDGVVLLDGGSSQTIAFRDDEVRNRARALWAGRTKSPPDVIARLVREADAIVDEEPSDYRAAPHEVVRRSIRCIELELAPPKESVLPENAEEIRWILAWSARMAAFVGTILTLHWLR